MKRFFPALIALSLCGVALGGHGEHNKGSVSSEVTTKPTGIDGRRHSDSSDWTVFTVPANFVIIKDKTTVHEVSAAGSEHNATVEYADYVEVVPGTGIQQPRTIKVKTFARGPKGHNAGRGWMKVIVSFDYVAFKD